MTVANVSLWGTTIGAVAWDESVELANFEYRADFLASGIELAPFTMPLSDQIYSFSALPRSTFRGLPGLLADSLPDDFGNALIDVWLAKEGRSSANFNPVERLCYTGSRGMGALEYTPAEGPKVTKSTNIDVSALVEFASEILNKRTQIKGSFDLSDRETSLKEILQVGTSAGGARAKAVIAWNSNTNEVRSGQVETEIGFSHWLLKFDGVSSNNNKEMGTPADYSLIEYAYYKMALAAGIEMSECRLLKENGRNHFMTRRFDRSDLGHKIHMQSLGAIEHFDFNKAGAYSYEQALRTIQKLNLPMDCIEEQFRRMAFNIIGRNQDDHVKNISFLMNRSGTWSLSPAYDMTYSYNLNGVWTGTHQMSLNGKRDNFELEDFKTCAKTISMKRGRAEDILKEVQSAVLNWKHFARNAGISSNIAKHIAKTHRTSISHTK